MTTLDTSVTKDIYKVADESSSQAKAAFYKDKKGDVWFMGIYSNNFEDREGEILTWDAHLEYAKWFTDNALNLPIVMLHQPKFPNYFHIFHTYAMDKLGLLSPQEYAKNIRKLYKSTTIATAERVIPLNGFVLVVGKVRKDRYETVEKMTGSWGMSHGFIKLKHDGNIINKYRTFEFTLAPSEWAANAITLIGFTKEDKIMADEKLTKEERDLLESFLNGSADDLEEATKEARNILSRVFNSKTLDEVTEEDPDEEAPETEEPTDEDITEYEVLRDKIFGDLDVKGLIDTFKQISDVLNQHTQQFEDLQKELKKTNDERVAEFISPDWKVFFANHKTEGEQDTDILDQLKEKTGQPITEEPKEVNKSNPLSQGFWGHLVRGEN